MASIFLAGKIEDTPVKIRDVINVAYRYVICLDSGTICNEIICHIKNYDGLKIKYSSFVEHLLQRASRSTA